MLRAGHSPSEWSASLSVTLSCVSLLCDCGILTTWIFLCCWQLLRNDPKKASLAPEEYNWWKRVPRIKSTQCVSLTKSTLRKGEIFQWFYCIVYILGAASTHWFGDMREIRLGRQSYWLHLWVITELHLYIHPWLPLPDYQRSLIENGPKTRSSVTASNLFHLTTHSHDHHIFVLGAAPQHVKYIPTWNNLWRKRGVERSTHRKEFNLLLIIKFNPRFQSARERGKAEGIRQHANDCECESAGEKAPLMKQRDIFRQILFRGCKVCRRHRHKRKADDKLFHLRREVHQILMRPREMPRRPFLILLTWIIFPRHIDNGESI